MDFDKDKDVNFSGKARWIKPQISEVYIAHTICDCIILNDSWKTFHRHKILHMLKHEIPSWNILRYNNKSYGQMLKIQAQI